jgi:hypothetical protein
MFKRKVYEELGGWDKVRIGGDTEFIWRVKAKYGASSYAQIAGHIPLAFALDDESSLTRTKMTHVRTVYFGLRHIYRETCAWWHRTNKELHIEGAVSRASFAIPKAMVSRDGQPIELDALFVSDFSNDALSAPIYELITNLNEKGLKAGMLHWPEFTTAPGRLTNRYFELLEMKGNYPIVGGDILQSEVAIYAGSSLIQHAVDMHPVLMSESIDEYVLTGNDKESLDGTSMHNTLNGDANFIVLDSLYALLERKLMNHIEIEK